jgi:hypothetical protein
MNNNPNETIDIESFSKKETYTDAEKKLIMDRLNEQRLIDQRAAESLAGKNETYTEEEKKKILFDLNEKRLSVQEEEEIKKRRTYKKEIYKFGSKSFYKFTNMKREYYIDIEDCKKISRRPRIISLHYRTLDVLHKKDVLIKTEIYSEKFFISFDAIRVYFKAYELEKKH